MARYVTLIRFTEQGAKKIGQSTKRASAFRKAAEKAGVNVECQYWTAGSFDGILIINAASTQAALHSLAQLAAGGNVRTETLQAFDSDEFAAITSK